MNNTNNIKGNKMKTTKEQRIIKFSIRYARLSSYKLTDKELNDILSLELNRTKLNVEERTIICDHIDSLTN